MPPGAAREQASSLRCWARGLHERIAGSATDPMGESVSTTSLYVSSTGANARLRQLEIVANNLANSDTKGFRADQASFRDALAASLDGARAAGRGSGLHVLVRTRGPAVRHQAGPVARTGGALDAAIEGPGFFAVQTPSGTRYTRAGSFRVAPDGLLATRAGYPVLGSGGPIAVGSRAVRIREDGQLVDPQGAPLGQLSVEIFDDPSLLTKEGENLFAAPRTAGRQRAPALTLIAGALEGSNVNPMQELAQLVVLQRAFDASMEALQADDAASQKLNQEVSR